MFRLRTVVLAGLATLLLGAPARAQDDGQVVIDNRGDQHAPLSRQQPNRDAEKRRPFEHRPRYDEQTNHSFRPSGHRAGHGRFGMARRLAPRSRDRTPSLRRRPLRTRARRVRVTSLVSGKRAMPGRRSFRC